MKSLRLGREAWASAMAQPVMSLAAIVMIAGMFLAVLLTQGRSVGAQQAVFSTFDDAGTRSITVRTQGGAGVDSSVLDRLDGISSITWAVGFGGAVDVTNSAVPGGERVPLRVVYGLDLGSLGIDVPGIDGGAYASPEALDRLGMTQAAGAVKTSEGAEHPLVDVLDVPDQLRSLEPLLIVPASIDATATEIRDPLAVLVVIADDAENVDELTDVVAGVLDPIDPQAVTIETSQRLAALRQAVDAQLSGVTQALTLGIFAITAILVAAILTALVMMRRRDYGRRRALGASQTTIVALVVMQTAMLATLGAAVGVVVAFVTLLFAGDPQPPPGYYLAIAILAFATGTVASVIPALVAARRDPARELRVP